ncbi:MAG: type II toxin-antitoxin system VapC family toxin [Candidatus Dormibacteraceae bacterium]
MENSLVLDASALLALINQEPGGEEVFLHVDQAVISTVNLAEVGSKLTDRGIPPEEIRLKISGFPLKVYPFDEQAALHVISLRSKVPNHISLADRACLALAAHLGVPAWTADKVWATLNLFEPEIHLIR